MATTASQISGEQPDWHLHLVIKLGASDRPGRLKEVEDLLDQPLSTEIPIRAVAAVIEGQDVETRVIVAMRDELRKERTRLQEFNNFVIAQQAKRSEWVIALGNAIRRDGDRLLVSAE